MGSNGICVAIYLWPRFLHVKSALIGGLAGQNPIIQRTAIVVYRFVWQGDNQLIILWLQRRWFSGLTFLLLAVNFLNGRLSQLDIDVLSWTIILDQRFDRGGVSKIVVRRICDQCVYIRLDHFQWVFHIFLVLNHYFGTFQYLFNCLFAISIFICVL